MYIMTKKIEYFVNKFYINILIEDTYTKILFIAYFSYKYKIERQRKIQRERSMPKQHFIIIKKKI